ncbi:DEAD-box ATP-dependent RNA helicase 31-like, partial [Trifolium medium]|nr:DEAD-box ATP-dependent RNA helicase 31-like [Trifolium medium]
ILVATPGRLRDHIDSTAGFPSRLMGVKALVLDEADHLLDMGFRKDIDKIIASVPKQRQTLMFSATIPDGVHQVCKIALKKDFEFINTVQEGTEETHAKSVSILDEKVFPVKFRDEHRGKMIGKCTMGWGKEMIAQNIINGSELWKWRCNRKGCGLSGDCWSLGGCLASPES